MSSASMSSSSMSSACVSAASVSSASVSSASFDDLNEDVIGCIFNFVPPASMVSVYLTCQSLHRLAAKSRIQGVDGMNIYSAAMAEGSFDLVRWWYNHFPIPSFNSDEEESENEDDDKLLRINKLFRAMARNAGRLGVVEKASEGMDLIQKLLFRHGGDLTPGDLRRAFIKGIAKTNDAEYYLEINKILLLGGYEMKQFAMQTLEYKSFGLFNIVMSPQKGKPPKLTSADYERCLKGGPEVLDFMAQHPEFKKHLKDLILVAMSWVLEKSRYSVSEWMETIFRYHSEMFVPKNTGVAERHQDLLLIYLERDSEYVRAHASDLKFWRYYVPEMQPYIVKWTLDECILDEDNQLDTSRGKEFVFSMIRAFGKPVSKHIVNELVDIYKKSELREIADLLPPELLGPISEDTDDSSKVQARLKELLEAGVSEGVIYKALSGIPIAKKGRAKAVPVRATKGAGRPKKPAAKARRVNDDE